MKTYRILEIVEEVFTYDVDAESEQEALQKINESFGAETDDIGHLPEYDDVINREYECEGEV